MASESPSMIENRLYSSDHGPELVGLIARVQGDRNRTCVKAGAVSHYKFWQVEHVQRDPVAASNTTRSKRAGQALAFGC